MMIYIIFVGLTFVLFIAFAIGLIVFLVSVYNLFCANLDVKSSSDTLVRMHEILRNKAVEKLFEKK